MGCSAKSSHERSSGTGRGSSALWAVSWRTLVRTWKFFRAVRTDDDAVAAGRPWRRDHRPSAEADVWSGEGVNPC